MPKSERHSGDESYDSPRLVRLVVEAMNVPAPDRPECQQLDDEQCFRPDQTARHADLRRKRVQERMSSAESISNHSSGSGIVGTVPGLTGSRPARRYCSCVSSTTAPVSGVTIW